VHDHLHPALPPQQNRFIHRARSLIGIDGWQSVAGRGSCADPGQKGASGNSMPQPGQLSAHKADRLRLQPSSAYQYGSSGCRSSASAMSAYQPSSRYWTARTATAAHRGMNAGGGCRTCGTHQAHTIQAVHAQTSADDCCPRRLMSGACPRRQRPWGRTKSAEACERYSPLVGMRGCKGWVGAGVGLNTSLP